MAWFAELAGKAETLLNNLDEQTGAALRNHHVSKTRKHDKIDNVLNNEPTWNQKKRPIPSTYKKITPIKESRSNYTSNRKLSPTQLVSQPKNGFDIVKNGSPKPKRNPPRKYSPPYTLENCPKTLVGDVKEGIAMNKFTLKHRRSSLPIDLEVDKNNDWTYKMQNLIVENAMLTNEQIVMNREITELVERLHKTEDDVSKTHLKLENLEMENDRIHLENESCKAEIGQLKQKINEVTEVDLAKFKEINQSLETQVSILIENSNELEERYRQQSEKLKEKETTCLKLDTELRHAQSTVGELENNLEKSMSECKRLENEWDTYKLRVKSMLHAKDKEIKALQEGLNLTEDTKMLMEKIDSLKEEREELSDAVSQIRNECSNMKQYIEQLENRNNAAEHVVGALRDAMKEERAARNRAEAHCIALGKELKSMQFESGQTIASLRAALRDKENDLNILRESTSSLRSTDTSALNVADYDVTQDSIDTEKLHYLTQTLVQKQGRIDSLLADNNILRIQLEKMESKYKTEVAALRANHTHSVVPVQDGGDIRFRSRNYIPDSTMSALSMRMGVVMKRYPFFRILILIYMVGLHLWVLTVLFTSTPEDYVTRPSKS